MISKPVRFTPAPFQITRGFHGVDETTQHESPPPETVDYEGEIEGEVRTPPFLTNWHSGNSYDSSSTTEVVGRVGKYQTRHKQELDFTVSDTDGKPNLEVSVAQDFTGAGRLQIRNQGDHGGDGQIDFPVGDLSKNRTRTNALAYEHDRASQVHLRKDENSARIEIVSNDDTRVFLVENGVLFRERSET